MCPGLIPIVSHYEGKPIESLRVLQMLTLQSLPDSMGLTGHIFRSLVINCKGAWERKLTFKLLLPVTVWCREHSSVVFILIFCSILTCFSDFTGIV